MTSRHRPCNVFLACRDAAPDQVQARRLQRALTRAGWCVFRSGGKRPRPAPQAQAFGEARLLVVVAISPAVLADPVVADLWRTFPERNGQAKGRNRVVTWLARLPAERLPLALRNRPVFSAGAEGLRGLRAALRTWWGDPPPPDRRPLAQVESLAAVDPRIRAACQQQFPDSPRFAAWLAGRIVAMGQGLAFAEVVASSLRGYADAVGPGVPVAADAPERLGVDDDPIATRRIGARDSDATATALATCLGFVACAVRASYQPHPDDLAKQVDQRRIVVRPGVAERSKQAHAAFARLWLCAAAMLRGSTVDARVPLDDEPQRLARAQRARDNARRQREADRVVRRTLRALARQRAGEPVRPIAPSTLAVWQVHVDGRTAYDPHTGLEWQRDPLPQPLTWREAVHYAATLDLRGAGWRLPTRVELLALDHGEATRDALGDAHWFDAYWTGAPRWNSPMGGDGETRIWTVRPSARWAQCARVGSRFLVRCVRPAAAADASAGIADGRDLLTAAPVASAASLQPVP